MSQPILSETDATTLRPHVPEDEQVIWTGRPDPDKWFTGNDWYLIPFGLIWLGGVLFIVFFRIPGSDTPLGAKLLLVPFFIIGLYMAVGRLIVKRWAKQRTRYSLTVRHAVVVGTRGRVRVVRLDEVPIVELPSLRGRHVSVFFEDRHSIWTPQRRPPLNAGLDMFDQGPTAFYDVADVEGLRQALRRVER